MKAYANAFLVGGVVIPILLHMVGGMSWWPDTVSLGLAFGAGACAMVWRFQKDQEFNRRLWTGLKAIYHRWDSH